MTPDELEQELREKWVTPTEASLIIGITPKALRDKFTRKYGGARHFTTINTPFGARLFLWTDVEEYAQTLRERRNRRRDWREDITPKPHWYGPDAPRLDPEHAYQIELGKQVLIELQEENRNRRPPTIEPSMPIELDLSTEEGFE